MVADMAQGGGTSLATAFGYDPRATFAGRAGRATQPAECVACPRRSGGRAEQSDGIRPFARPVARTGHATLQQRVRRGLC